MALASTEQPHPSAIAVLVNGASSSGKSRLCQTLLDQLTDLADGDPLAAFTKVAFDDIVGLIPYKLYPISFAKLQGGDPGTLSSRVPFDGRASWEYVDDSHAEGKHGGSPRMRLVLNAHGERVLKGLQSSWGAHLQLGTNLLIDHYIQDADWYTDFQSMLRESGARLFSVGVHCALAELERREASRGDGKVEGRPLGLARRSDELCHAHPLEYDLTVQTDQETTEQSVARIIAALNAWSASSS